MDADDGLQRPRAPTIPMLRELHSRWHVCSPRPRRFFQGPDTDDKEVVSPSLVGGSHGPLQTFPLGRLTAEVHSRAGTLAAHRKK